MIIINKRLFKITVGLLVVVTFGTTVVEPILSVQASQISQSSVVSEKSNGIVKDVQEARQILFDYGYTPFEIEYASDKVLIQEAVNIRSRSVTSWIIKEVTKELEKKLGKRTARLLARRFGSLMHFAQALVKVSDETDKSVSGWVYRECRKMGFSRETSKRIATICHYVVEIIL